MGLDPAYSALDIWSLGIVDAQNRVGIRGTLGVIEYPGAGSDWWLSPQVLNRKADVLTPQLKILRMPYSMGGTAFRAIRFQTANERGFLAWNYDLETGVLLRSVTSSVGGPIQGPIAQGDSRQGQTMITHNDIREVRVQSIPWASAPAVFPISVTLERAHVGSNWVRYVQHTQAPGLNPPVARVFGSAQFGGLWVPPAALGQLRPGQVLDQDRVTGVVTSVGQIGRVIEGIDGVVISLVGSGFRLDHLYDRQSGVLACLSRVETYLRYEIRLANWQ